MGTLIPTLTHTHKYPYPQPMVGNQYPCLSLGASSNGHSYASQECPNVGFGYHFFTLFIISISAISRLQLG